MSGALLVPLILVMVAVAGVVFAIASGAHDRQVVRESLRSLDGYDLADGALIGLNDPGHCVTVAGSRAGKGVSIIVPPVSA